jgi:hypothetical protein
MIMTILGCECDLVEHKRRDGRDRIILITGQYHGGVEKSHLNKRSIDSMCKVPYAYSLA